MGRSTWHDTVTRSSWHTVTKASMGSQPFRFQGGPVAGVRTSSATRPSDMQRRLMEVSMDLRTGQVIPDLRALPDRFVFCTMQAFICLRCGCLTRFQMLALRMLDRSTCLYQEQLRGESARSKFSRHHAHYICSLGHVSG